MVVVGLVIANVILTIAMIIDAVTMDGPIRVNGDIISSNEVSIMAVNSYLMNFEGMFEIWQAVYA